MIGLVSLKSEMVTWGSLVDLTRNHPIRNTVSAEHENISPNMCAFFYLFLSERVISHHKQYVPFCRLDMVEIRGKRGRRVAVILTPELRDGIDLLNQTRSAVCIPVENPYVFARANRQSLEPLRGWDCLRDLATSCEPQLQNPGAITSTRLRKYIATITQVLSLKEKEVDWLARHLGHDIRIHREFYRLHESTIEIAKVSKLLLAVDSGKTTKLSGKSLDEITIDGELSSLKFLIYHL